MGKSSSSQPKAPDPTATANAQSASNTNTAISNAWLNSPNISTPYGNITTTQNGTHTVNGQQIPTFLQTQTLSPEQQTIYEQGVQGDTQLNQLGLDQLGRVKDAVSTPFSLDQFGTAPTADAAYRDQQYNAILQRAQPQQDQQRAALEQRLANQGIGIGSEAYNDAMNQFGQNVNDFNLGAQAQSGNEEAQQYGLQSQAYQQAISNALLQRQQPLQELSQFMGNSNAFQSPGVVGTPQSTIQPTDTTSPVYANYNAQVQQAGQNQSATNSLYGGLAGLAGSALGGWASSW